MNVIKSYLSKQDSICIEDGLNMIDTFNIKYKNTFCFRVADVSDKAIKDGRSVILGEIKEEIMLSKQKKIDKHLLEDGVD